MKPNLLFIALLLLANAVLMAQKPFSGKKIDRYFDENEREISKKEYESHDGWEENFMRFEVETDSSIRHLIEKTYAGGKIGSSTMAEIHALLGRQSSVAVDTSKILVIQFYPGIDPCSGNEYKPFVKANFRAFDKKIAKLEGVSSHYFHKKGADIGVRSRYANWLPDESQILQRTFFWYDYPCGSFVVIAPDGEFFEVKGEYAPDYIFTAITILAGKPVFEKQVDRYFDENGKEISQRKFDSSPKFSLDYLITVCETDSCIRHAFEKKVEHGRLSAEDMAKIRQQFERLPGAKFDPKKTLVVQFFTGNSSASFDPGGCAVDLGNCSKNLMDFSEKHPEATVLFLHGAGAGMGDRPEFSKWLPDTDGAIERAFFDFRHPCINLVAINPDGEFFAHKFERDTDRFLGSAKKLMRKNK